MSNETSKIIEADAYRAREVATVAQPIATPPVLTEETVLLQIISRAAQDKTIDLDRMERLMVMHERMNAKRAEQQFEEAMARFKTTAPKILKDKHVYFESRKEGSTATDYHHASLGAVCEAIIGGLGEQRINHAWELERKEARIFVTCVLKGYGHSTRTTLDGPPDTSGNKNPVQQVTSTITMLERYTLLAAVGMGTHDQPDATGTNGTPVEYITEKQIADLEALITEVGANKIALLNWLKLPELGHIRASNYSACVQSLEQKRKS